MTCGQRVSAPIVSMLFSNQHDRIAKENMPTHEVSLPSTTTLICQEALTGLPSSAMLQNGGICLLHACTEIWKCDARCRLGTKQVKRGVILDSVDACQRS